MSSKKDRHHCSTLLYLSFNLWYLNLKNLTLKATCIFSVSSSTVPLHIYYLLSHLIVSCACPALSICSNSFPAYTLFPVRPSIQILPIHPSQLNSVHFLTWPPPYSPSKRLEILAFPARGSHVAQTTTKKSYWRFWKSICFPDKSHMTSAMPSPFLPYLTHM